MNTWEPMDYIIDDYAMEGYNIDTVKAIKANPKTKELINNLAEAKKAAKEGKRKGALLEDRITNLKLAIKLYKSCIDKAQEFKREVDQLREPGTKIEKFLSGLTPIFMWKFPESEFDKVTVDPTFTYYNGQPGVGANITIHTKSYVDKMSEDTLSKVKSSVQMRLNLFIKKCDREMRMCQGLLEKIS